ncbi:hypothetical protein CLD06_05610 [Wolbachia endosymbiont of Drosophila subpulchrella]|nr:MULTISPECIES: WPE palindromic element domain-containing protein [unclassified Wolbachia]MBA8767364.1 hypothetical protein [Wolbachia pipientis]MDX5497481.1 WPE palindromic element domain-containing protein [Wolbachia endosymbiont of Lasioglossum nitidulum]MDX5509966.1 WPE palindromic element domain-containing protein [Wolbachia endosymbiont of Lasioglossum morio]MDX5561592.1 WPE palindromic element domain-containing protein [Wolbachia endosymbiont of Andrena bicolor]PBD15513.1 hypothetical 
MLDLLQHYFGVNNCYPKYSSSVIPVLDYLDPENLILNEYIRLLYNKSWIPVSATCMTPPATQTSVDYKESSYSCRSSHRVTKKGYWDNKRGTL